MPETRKPKIAFWFRYGAAEHAELFHALPELIKSLSDTFEVHYFGMKSDRPIPEAIRNYSSIHELPFTVNRTSNRDKFIKTLLWIVLLPWIARRSKRMGMDAVYIDETIPFSAVIARTLFGPTVAITVADFFVDIYLAPNPMLRPVAKWIRRLDLTSWKKLPLIITRAKTTRDYLVQQGLQEHCIEPIYDPCDEKVFFPTDKAACRKEFGYSDNDVVLVHHGILHPNKGNDRIIKAMAKLRYRFPNLHYLLVGDGQDMEHLKELVKDNHLEDCVKLTGWLPGRTDVNRALNAGDIGLVMRVGHESDNFHMTGALVHAMACGLPILAARLGGISEAVRDGENGFLFDPVCTAEFDRKLEILINDPSLRKRLGEEAYRDSRHLFSMDSVIQQTIRALTTLVEKPT